MKCSGSLLSAPCSSRPLEFLPMNRSPEDPYGMEPSRPEDYDEVRLQVIRQRWDQKADRWDGDLADPHCHLNQDDAYDRFLSAADAVVAARASFCRNRLLVDLGCGTGLVLAHFVDRFERALGIDISPRMLAVAAARRLPRVELLQGSCFELDRAGSEERGAGSKEKSSNPPLLAARSPLCPAGAVFSRGILLSHYGERWAVPLLRQICEVLVPDEGFAILDFLNARARSGFPTNPDNKTYFMAEQIGSYAKAAGFRQGSILGAPERRVLLLLAER